MKTIDEMLVEVQADRDRRQQLEQEQEQKRRDYQEAVTLAEKEMHDALARQDQEAYHAAEGRLSYAREVLRAFEATSPWWTPEEAAEILANVFKAYTRENREKYAEVLDHIHKINDLLGEAYHISRQAYSIDTTVRIKLKRLPLYAYSLTRQEVPYDWACHIAREIGQTYSPSRKN